MASKGVACRRCLLLFPDLHGCYKRIVDEWRDARQVFQKVAQSRDFSKVRRRSEEESGLMLRLCPEE